MVKCSLVIRCYNEEKHIGRLLSGIIEKTVHPIVKVMAINVRSVYLGVRQLYPLMKSQGGVIVNVSSVHEIATCRLSTE